MLTLKQTVVIKAWLDDKVAELQASVRKNFKATGKAADSIEGSIVQPDRAIIIGADYLEFGEFGRGKTNNGSRPGILKDLIRKWIDVKGIQPKDNISKDNLAFLITRKIHRDGIKVPNKYNAGKILSSVINDKSISELIDQYGAVLRADIESDILTITKAA